MANLCAWLLTSTVSPPLMPLRTDGRLAHHYRPSRVFCCRLAYLVGFAKAISWSRLSNNASGSGRHVESHAGKAV